MINFDKSYVRHASYSFLPVKFTSTPSNYTCVIYILYNYITHVSFELPTFLTERRDAQRGILMKIIIINFFSAKLFKTMIILKWPCTYNKS